MPFQDPLTEDDLYWIGYIRADGSILSNRGTLVLGFCQAQIEPVAAFREYAGIKNPVHSRDVRGKSFGLGFKHEVSCVMHADRLAELGVKTELRPDIFKSVDFWRGFCDGDGCISAWSKGHHRYAAFHLCGTLEDMSEFQSWLRREMNHEITVSRAGPIFKVQCAGKKAAEIITYLYKDKYSANIIKSAKAKEWFI